MAEKTFRSFSKEDGAKYALYRFNYSPNLYQMVLDYHKSSGGQFDTVLDVGCGPGIAIANLYTHFTHAIGLEPSQGMIDTARAIHSDTPITFVVSSAEELATIAPASVDLLVAATAAHWFDMPKFWARAAEVVKPRGTVAIWCGGPVSVGEGIPGREAIQAAVDRLDERLDDYMLPGNRLVRDLYVDLVLPWTAENPIEGFDKESFTRQEWGTDAEGSLPGTEYMAVKMALDLDGLEKVLGTASPVIRWREAHPELVGTEEDVVRRMRREIEAVFRDEGVDEKDQKLDGGIAATLLMLKRTGA
ncbi:S-adenosyl-L-methionine-dependent methyltransferase [Echria macrotheca]|uniref:S-adenosyl-L-methionine-dependent methyltransferase n=1 Tax=Echria macrotheca TaxID=438768 RepID=A0AAJ0F0P2_9PEZI|nr:S-adenosyl-L-methionine-dependent methyltransferase [Echria macrotheca]